MALKKVKGTLERVLDKNLQDLVRGIRNHKENESKYIAECIDEIKQELKQDNLAIKANAVNKLAYLQMLGYDISWAAFNIIEVMSSTKFTFKRVGYLAASQCFHDGTDVLMLTTNMIRKDMSSVNLYDAGVALSGLSCFITSDLARDLANDIMTLMTSSKPYLRKKAVLIMYKVFLQFPEALRPAFPRLKEKLEDPDPGVQSAAVNVICELARKNPKNYLSLAPLFFKLMTTSTNNWVLIKIIKLFGALTPLEPRLGKKLIEPLTNLIHSTSAMSLLYECINTVIAGIPNHSASIQLCVQKLRILIEDSDQNLKYLGLLAMSRILATHPKSVQGHKDLILQCLDDKDESIRLRALDLLYGMVTKKNLMEIVKKLMVHMDKAEGSHYRDELLSKIVVICSQSNYQFVTNFEWYVSILVELTRMEGTRHGGLIAAQMLDVAIRVNAIRHFAVSQMAILLENSHLLANNSQRNGICEVLYAAAWICGEFSEHLKNPQQTLEAMLRPKLTSLPGHIQSIYVQNLLKLYCKVLRRLEDETDHDSIAQVHTTLQEKLPIFVQSGDLEVQERACSMLALVKYVIKIREKGVSVGDELAQLYAGELNPVAAKAQRKVPVPEGLDLDAWINQPESDSSEEEETVGVGFFSSVGNDEHRSAYQSESLKNIPEPTPEELEKRREARRTEQEHNPHYLKDDGQGKKSRRSKDNDVSSIPVAAIDLNVPLHVPGLSSSDKYMQLDEPQPGSRSRKEGKSRGGKKGKKKRRKGKESESEEDVETMHAVSTVLDAPDGAEFGSDKDDDDNKDPYKMLDINLDAPLRDDETLPVRTHRIVLEDGLPENGAAGGLLLEKPKKKHKKEKKEKKEKRSKKDKKKRSKSDSHEENGPSLLLATGGEEEEAVEINNREETPQEEETQGGDDLDFWLSEGSQQKGAAATNGDGAEPDKTGVAAAASSSIPPIKVSAAELVLTSDEEERDADEKPRKKKEKKSKKEKEKKEKKKKKSKEKRSGYIEPEGITTPSKENLPPSQQPTPMEVKLPPMSSYTLLAENASIKLTYEVRITHQRQNQVVVSIVFANLTSHTLKDLEFNVLDTLNSKLIRGLGHDDNDVVKVPFTLPPGAQNEGQFAFSVEEITAPQKLRGTLTFILKSSDGSSHEKVDFRINLPCSAYLLTSPCKSEDFAALLGSGELTAKGAVKVNVDGVQFVHVVARLSFFLHFREVFIDAKMMFMPDEVVEQVADSVSLFSRSIQDHPVCLLVKMVDGALAVDGKSTDGSFLSNILEDVRTVCSEAVSASQS